ncbi:MAG: cobaltochelatase subunit CobN [Thermoflexales bacterium]|nr:cobaltochelatase subunit CobN [Thermoflexales bacterium]MDW8352078.1 cobaltochelatase subunit CobN [Anaerolineae bacterium]
MNVSQPHTRVLRSDGKYINLVLKTGHLFVCKGCCCGHVERGHAPVPEALYHNEWERRRLRNRVHLTIGGCLGPCPLSNVVLLNFAGTSLWFQSFNTDWQVLALYDYIEAMLAANRLLPVPEALRPFVFNFYAWQSQQAAAAAGEGAIGEAPAAAEAYVAPIVVLSHADTDLLAVRRARSALPDDFPAVATLPLEPLRHPEALARFERGELRDAQLVLARVEGGLENAPQLRHIAEFCRQADRVFLCVSAIQPDPQLDALSTDPTIAREVYAYLQEGGIENATQLLLFLSDHYFATGYGFAPPQLQPRLGIYHPKLGRLCDFATWQAYARADRPTIGAMFYRAHWLSGNTAFVDALVAEIEAQGANALPFFVSTRNDLATLIRDFGLGDAQPMDAMISTVSFAMSPEVAAQARFPILQAITAGTTREQWLAAQRGLGPLDTAMNVVLPEFDGRVITVPTSFKHEQAYLPDLERVARLVRLALGYARLRRKPNAEKRVAFVLTNSSAKAGKIGNAVGLDGPASLLRIFAGMRERGYTLQDVPEDGDALMHAIISRGSYDTDFLLDFQRQHAFRVPVERYAEWNAELTPFQRRYLDERWGGPPGSSYVHDGAILFSALELGNVLVALQPPRGYADDPEAIYHSPDLPPSYQYHAFYRWLTTPREAGGWGADAIVHMGTHGTLEWLPGKGVGPSADCFPDSLIGDVPFFYPYIVSNPGEGAQAKRRAHAVILDHLMPPQTTAELYGELAELAQLVTEYYACEATSPDKLPILQSQIWSLICRAQLDKEIEAILKRQNAKHSHSWDPTLTPEGIPVRIVEFSGKEFAHMMEDVDGYLCELQSLQIHCGLHVLGESPRGEMQIDTMHALLHLPNLDVPSLRAAVAAALDARLDHDWRRGKTQADQRVDAVARALLRALADRDFDARQVEAIVQAHLPDAPNAAEIAAALRYACAHIAPALARTSDEITNLLDALEGRPVPAGPAGAPTRGMAHVLPTGRNFFTVDPRALPSPTSWQVGKQLAETLVERYRAEQGSYPERIGLSIWGTTAIRTQGDDIAQALALLGVRPVWQRENRRVVGLEVIPLSELGRPRVDVLMRITGFLRDALPHVIALLDEAAQMVISLDEPLEQNAPRRLYFERLASLINAGIAPQEADRRSRYRVFGSKPGAYGAGILPLIEAGNWQDVRDFALAYVNWGGYAYTRSEEGTDAREDFRAALAKVQVAAKNQDNREHDIFTYDDYLQYHGGMIAAIRALSGKPPLAYFGDSSDPSRVRTRSLKEEAARVFRSRVVNPKWIQSMMKHGYKGGLEMAATVDYLFGYDATSDVIEDWMYETLAERYALDHEAQAFLRRSNPWALREIIQRLLEAIERGLWQADEAMHQRLLDALAELSGDLEDFMDRAWLSHGAARAEGSRVRA